MHSNRRRTSTSPEHEQFIREVAPNFRNALMSFVYFQDLVKNCACDALIQCAAAAQQALGMRPRRLWPTPWADDTGVGIEIGARLELEKNFRFGLGLLWGSGQPESRSLYAELRCPNEETAEALVEFLKDRLAPKRQFDRNSDYVWMTEPYNIDRTDPLSTQLTEIFVIWIDLVHSAMECLQEQLKPES